MNMQRTPAQLYIMLITGPELDGVGWPLLARILLSAVVCFGVSAAVGLWIGRRLHEYTPRNEGGDDA